MSLFLTAYTDFTAIHISWDIKIDALPECQM